jgi:hypothetical protein
MKLSPSSTICDVQPFSLGQATHSAVSLSRTSTPHGRARVRELKSLVAYLALYNRRRPSKNDVRIRTN